MARSVEQPVDRKRFLGSGRRNRTAVRIDGSRLSARGWGRLIDGSAGRQIERSLATAPEKSERQDAGQERQNANERAHEAIPTHRSIYQIRAFLGEPFGVPVPLMPGFFPIF